MMQQPWRLLLLAAAALGAVSCAHGTPALLAEGTAAPPFAVTAHDGRLVELQALRGHPVVLYFYPADDTSGCTKEACDFRDSWDRLQRAGVVVLGVSEQGAASHTAFASKYSLPFQLLPDENGALAGLYHVPVHLGYARRVTYLIDATGRIARVWPDVKPAGHAAQILAALPQP